MLPRDEKTTMDEILTFIIILVVLYLINRFSKKLKKQQAGQSPAAPAPPIKQVPQPSDLDSAGQETMPTYLPQEPLEDFENDEDYFEDKEELIEQEVISEAFKEPEEIVAQPPPPEEPFEELNREASTPSQRPRMTLKQYIIWKEILDKPLSMRNCYHLSKNRVS